MFWWYLAWFSLNSRTFRFFNTPVTLFSHLSTHISTMRNFHAYEIILTEVVRKMDNASQLREWVTGAALCIFNLLTSGWYSRSPGQPMAIQPLSCGFTSHLPTYYSNSSTQPAHHASPWIDPTLILFGGEHDIFSRDRSDMLFTPSVMCVIKSQHHTTMMWCDAVTKDCHMTEVLLEFTASHQVWRAHQTKYLVSSHCWQALVPQSPVTKRMIGCYHPTDSTK